MNETDRRITGSDTRIVQLRPRCLPPITVARYVFGAKLQIGCMRIAHIISAHVLLSIFTTDLLPLPILSAHPLGHSRSMLLCTAEAGTAEAGVRPSIAAIRNLGRLDSLRSLLTSSQVKVGMSGGCLETELSNCWAQSSWLRKGSKGVGRCWKNSISDCGACAPGLGNASDKKELNSEPSVGSTWLGVPGCAGHAGYERAMLGLPH
eukprot:1143327-Pelagomonas_calceolata.AAC.4